MESFLAIHDFMVAYDLKTDQVGNLSFQALVEYRSLAKNVPEVTNVNIIRNGYRDGQISLVEISLKNQ